jgi:N-acetylglucosamine-6-sulfatase
VKRLEQHPDVLANTYIIYTSDNGYHIGQHRLPPGKTCPIEEDINVPFVIRGPGVGKGKEVTDPTSHTDIVPTIFRLAGIDLQDDFDGMPMPVIQALRSSRQEHINIEFWGANIPEGSYRGIGKLHSALYEILATN